MQYLINRLNESSTWLGVIKFGVGVLGLDISDAEVNTIVSGCLAVVGLAAMVLPDKIFKKGA